MARIQTSLGTLGMVERGTGGTPLVLLHGVGSTKSAWAPQLAWFGQQRRTIALDYPGYGESDPAPPFEGAAHDHLAEAILAAFDALDISEAHLCGLSLGGVVAIAAAHHRPKRIVSLVLADSFAVHPDGQAVLQRSLTASADMAAMARGRVPALFGAVATTRLRETVEAEMAAIDPEAFRIGAAAVWPADQRHRAAAISAPTLVLCGAEDRVTPPELSAELAALMPKARFELIDGAGHLANVEQPTLFNVAVDTFLRAVEQRTEAPRARRALHPF